MRTLGLVLLAVLTVVSFAPVVGLLAAGSLADWAGCQLDEGSPHPCLVAGVDLGDFLYTAGVLGWLMFVTWPGMLVSLGLWLWLLGRRLVRRRTIA